MENLTREKALELHRKMWTDMQKEFGDNPSCAQRDWYKEKWIKEHFPDEHVEYNCFLCEYTGQNSTGRHPCVACPVVWPAEPAGYCCTSIVNYHTMPISKLLSLPEREDK